MIVHDCEQRSQEWYDLRCGIPTASEFSRVVTSDGKPSKSRAGYAKTLAAELYVGSQVDAWEGSNYSDRGRFFEEEALARYEFDTDCTVTQTGLITDDGRTCGCSPDGLVGDVGMVEVKCLKAENHISAILYHRKNGAPPTDYIQQTQGQLLISGRQWCDLIFYHPSLPLLVIRQEPIAEVIDGLTEGIPALITERDEIVKILRGEV